ncbi:type VI secretion system lipoprotein TssJ [Massilia forsythiae]|uniref:Type VI secretion system lipoprotein TssJ n=1 Tax=Massilia forsythiae TaxID=2728020 RepID=A0A7Z2W0G8_9BURK|nr:type VI secretion system lipoprotein TssJ [Massilia forsythiae]QJE02858.1 type VI secretion system lipoprotein TssJ [Massilia forsythiae]
MPRITTSCPFVPLLLALPCLALVGGCAGGGNGLAGAALEATGLRKPSPPALPEALQPPRNVALHLHAAKRLNLDPRGQSLALLVRVYKLRQRAAFEQAPYAAFLSPQAEREALGADLVEVKEFTLVPGQRLDLNEKLARDASYIGVVALFHSPARDGWRLAFAAADAEQAGVTLGLHACAMSAGAGAPAAGAVAKAGSTSLALVRCQ